MRTIISVLLGIAGIAVTLLVELNLALAVAIGVVAVALVLRLCFQPPRLPPPPPAGPLLPVRFVTRWRPPW